MKDIKQAIYSNDLINILDRYIIQFDKILNKLNKDELISQGLFLMATTYFEAGLRDIMSAILRRAPDKLKDTEYKVSKDDLCSLNDQDILQSIVDKQLFSLFQGNVLKQLVYVVEIVSNIKPSKITNESKNSNIMDIITKCSDISYYRNVLIHDAGRPNKIFHENVKVYKFHMTNQRIIYNDELITNFINDYLEFFNVLKQKVTENSSFIPKPQSRLEQVRQLWNDCFSSPMLIFDSYWEVDIEKDLVVSIKYPDLENSISSSEKVFLSIWRHQFYDAIKTEEFLLCSIDEDKIYKLYKGLDDVKFYYMYQESHHSN